MYFVTIRVSTTALLALAVGLGLGCSSGSSTGSDGGVQLTLVDPSAPHADLQQGDTRQLSVRYRSNLGTPVVGAQIDFIMLGNTKGSTLSADAVHTDSAGLASVELRAGSASTEFAVRVIAPSVPYLSIEVTVTDFEPGTLNVQTGSNGALPNEQIERIDLLLYESTSCSTIDVVAPSTPFRSSSVDGIGASTAFRTLNVDRQYSLLGRGFGGKGRLRFGSCVDLPTGLLAGGKPVTFVLVLDDLAPRVAGNYALDSEIVLKNPIVPLAPLLHPWVDLSDCELDPAQLLLDCVVDAVDDGDPLDCVIPDGNHSALTVAILEERGALVAGCRTSLLANASPTLDKKISDLLNANGAKLLAAIASIPQAVEDALTRFHVGSSLRITPAHFADESGRLNATAQHGINGFILQGKDRAASYPIGVIVAPRPVTESAALIDDWVLSLAKHSLSLRLDLIARAALQDPVMVEAFENIEFDEGAPPSDARSLVGRLAELVKAPAAKPGCEAISRIICDAVGQPAQCVATACSEGLGALATYLDSGFVAAATSSQGVDLQWAGQALLADVDGDLIPDLIGSDPGDEDVTGTWDEIDLLLGGDDVNTHSATFQGLRLPPTPE